MPQLKILDRLKTGWKPYQDLCHHILVMYLKPQLNLAISLETYSSTKCGAGWLSPDEGSSLSPLAVCTSCFARNGRTFLLFLHVPLLMVAQRLNFFALNIRGWQKGIHRLSLDCF